MKFHGKIQGLILYVFCALRLIDLEGQVPNQAILKKVPVDENAVKRQYLSRAAIAKTNALLEANTVTSPPTSTEPEEHSRPSGATGNNPLIGIPPASVIIENNKQQPLLQ